MLITVRKQEFSALQTDMSLQDHAGHPYVNRVQLLHLYTTLCLFLVLDFRTLTPKIRKSTSTANELAAHR